MPDRSTSDAQRYSVRWALSGIAAVALTRVLFRSRVLYDLDSVNFALGMLRFDPSAHQPHPPGYFLYVTLAALINRFVANPNTALVAMSVAASCGAAWMIYLLSREWFGTEAARISVLLFLFSPFCWFHGIVALTYIVEAFFSALVGYLCWRASRGGRDSQSPPRSLSGWRRDSGHRPRSSWLLFG